MNDAQGYYDAVAADFDRIYARDEPEMQAELETVSDAMLAALRNRHVLEVACGTGFWTEKAAPNVQGIVATDASSRMLSVARKRRLSTNNIAFKRIDAFHLDSVHGTFDAGLANFWFSHIPKARIEEFLTGFHQKLGRHSVVFMADNVYVPWLGGELVVRPGVEDTFKLRRVSDESEYEVLKNYYDAVELRHIFEPRVQDLRVQFGTYFWWLSYATY